MKYPVLIVAKVPIKLFIDEFTSAVLIIFTLYYIFNYLFSKLFILVSKLDIFVFNDWINVFWFIIKFLIFDKFIFDISGVPFAILFNLFDKFDISFILLFTITSNSFIPAIHIQKYYHNLNNMVLLYFLLLLYNLYHLLQIPLVLLILLLQNMAHLLPLYNFLFKCWSFIIYLWL